MGCDLNELYGCAVVSQMWSRLLSPRVFGLASGGCWRSLFTMQLKTSEFQSLFSDGLNGLAGEWVALGCDVCVPVFSEGNIVPKHTKCTSMQLKHSSLYWKLF